MTPCCTQPVRSWREHVLVIRHDTPGIAMDLAGRSAPEITLLGPNARPEAAIVDVGVVTVGSVGYPQRAMEMACRALCRSGRIVLLSAAEVDDHLGDGIAHTLREASFSGLRLRIAAGQVIASAGWTRLAAQHSTGRWARPR